jgi:uncharacterized hydrophobic protein (TIGR00271 family)
MLELRVHGAPEAMDSVAEMLSELRGARHLTWIDAGARNGRAVVTVELSAEAADPALDGLSGLGVPAEDIALLRLDVIRPGARSRERANLLWADLVGRAAEYARPVARFLVFMGAAGVIAGYGVIYDNGILIVGAMAVAPDLLPIAACCIGLVLRRRRLVWRALLTLGAGLGFTGLVAGVLTVLLDLLNLLPSGFSVDVGVLEGLTTVNSSTFLVALAAGVAGMLALESRASAAVGVAISVTTVPAASYLGVAAGVGDISKAAGALAVLGINVAMLILGGTLTLAAQEALARRAASQSEVRVPAARA